MSMKEAAQELGKSYNQIRWQAYKMGITFRKKDEKHHRAQYSDELVTKTMAHYMQGMTQQEIAQKYHVPLGTLGNWLTGNTRADAIDWQKVEKECHAA